MVRYKRTVLWLIVLLLSAGAAAVYVMPASISRTWRSYMGIRRVEEALGFVRRSNERKKGTVVVVGDSSVLKNRHISTTEHYGFVLKSSIQNDPFGAYVLAWPGSGPITYYLIADELVALHPIAVILVANLQAFTEHWLENTRFRHPQLAGFVRPKRLLEALRMPLERAGISDEALLLMPIVRVFALTPVLDTISAYRQWFRQSELFGPATQPAFLADDRSIADLYPDGLDLHHPSVRALAATIRQLTGAEIPTFVLIQPIHVGALREAGVYERQRISEGTDALSKITRENGGIPIDLSHLLVEERFVDQHTHFDPEGTKLVVDRTLASLREVLSGRP